jgi:hypothetical protein
MARHVHFRRASGRGKALPPGAVTAKLYKEQEMLRNRLVHLVPMFALAGLVACGTDDTRTTVDADTTMIFEPTTETVEIERMGEDTLLVEERVETEVTVDTTRVDGGVRRDTLNRM